MCKKNAVKLIDPTLNKDEIFRKYKILKLDDMVKVEQCKLGYKLCHGLLPKALANNMVRDHNRYSISKHHKYQTRGKSIPNLQKGKNTDPASCSMQSNCTVSWIQKSLTVRICLYLSNVVKTCTVSKR